MSKFFADSAQVKDDAKQQRASLQRALQYGSGAAPAYTRSIANDWGTQESSVESWEATRARSVFPATGASRKQPEIRIRDKFRQHEAKTQNLNQAFRSHYDH